MDIINDNNYDIIIVGAGLSGSVIAERITRILKKKVLILEKRNHIGGNCYDYIDKDTGIRLNKYGAHLFHTNYKNVWDYVNNFCKWIRWEHKVFSNVNNKFVSIPVNITTVNELCNTNIQTQEEMNIWLSNNQIKYNKISNSEEMAKSRIGKKLYELLVKNYTYKQWNKYPEELNKSVLERIPIRNNFDTRYFSDKYQALPEKGYTYFFQQLLKNKLINIKLSTDYFEYKKKHSLKNIPIIFTGPIDSYYSNIGYPKLEYRSINFQKEYYNIRYYQPNSVINYPEKKYPYTRIVEYKHFLNQKLKDNNKTLIVKETTTDIGEPYYPVPTKKNIELYNKYKLLAEKEKNIYFIGRLATYKYINMDQAIKFGLDFDIKKLF